MAQPTLAIDIGGTKIAAGLVDDDGTLVHHAKRPTPDGDPEAIWAVVESLVAEALSTAGGAVRGVGIASAGPIDVPAGTVSPINITEWQHFPIVDGWRRWSTRPCDWVATGCAWRWGTLARRGPRRRVLARHGGVHRGRRRVGTRRRALRRSHRQRRTRRPCRRRPRRSAVHVRRSRVRRDDRRRPTDGAVGQRAGWNAPADADAKELADAAAAGMPWRCARSPGVRLPSPR